MEQNSSRLERVRTGLNFVLSHFDYQPPQQLVERQMAESIPLFPRMVSTAASGGSQFLVGSKEEALTAYEAAGFIDCRVNAFPAFADCDGRNRYQPDFIDIDLDSGSFRSPGALDGAMRNTVNRIWKQLGCQPSVVWTGNGYHVWLPIVAWIFENILEFNRFENPSVQFLRWAERMLSNSKSDPAHNPSLRSCLLRVPGTINSKCLAKSTEPEVRVLNCWDGRRPYMNLMAGSFYSYLTSERLKFLASVPKHRISRHGGNIEWIERLLKDRPLEDGRKFAIHWILAPYLVSVKKLQPEQAQAVILEWLSRCHRLRRLDFSPKPRVKDSVRDASRKGIPPMSLEKLRSRKPELYHILFDSNYYSGAAEQSAR